VSPLPWPQRTEFSQNATRDAPLLLPQRYGSEFVLSEDNPQTRAKPDSVILLLLETISVNDARPYPSQPAVKQIKKLGGSVVTVGSANMVILEGKKFTDSHMKLLLELKDRNSLRFNDTSVTDTGFKDVGRLKKLKDLRVMTTKITDAGVKDMYLHAYISDVRSVTQPHCCFACWEFVLGQWHELTARQVVGEDFASLDLVDPSVQM